MHDRHLILEKLREASDRMDMAVEAGERGDWPRLKTALDDIRRCTERLAKVVEPATHDPICPGGTEPSR
jgi:hypothetical protein